MGQAKELTKYHIQRRVFIGYYTIITTHVKKRTRIKKNWDSSHLDVGKGDVKVSLIFKERCNVFYVTANVGCDSIKTVETE